MLLKKKINFYAICLAIIIVLETNIFYIVDKYKFSFFGFLYYDLIVIINLFIFILYFILNIKSFVKQKMNWFILFGIFLIVSSSLAAMISYNQNIFYGILAQREWMSCLLLYFPIKHLIDKDKLNKNNILIVLRIISFVLIIMLLLQFLLINKIQFLNISVSERYDDVRLRVDLRFPILYMALCFDDVLQRKNNYFIDLLLCIMIILVIVFITKIRMAFVALLLSLTICLFIKKLNVKVKSSYLIFGLIIGIVFLFFSDLGKDILSFFSSDNTDNSFQYRKLEIEYYTSILKNSIIKILIGNGYPSNNCALAMNVDYYKYSTGSTFYTSDIGLLGHTFRYGLIGSVWVISTYLFYLVKAIKISKKNNVVGYILVLVFELIACYTLQCGLFLPSIDIILLIIIIEKEYKNIIKSKHYKKEILNV